MYIHLIKCRQCNRILCNIKATLVNEHDGCNRFFQCPSGIKNKHKCQNCPYEGENACFITCPYCETSTKIVFPSARLQITPGDIIDRKSILDIDSSSHIKIEKVEFKKNGLYIKLKI